MLRSSYPLLLPWTVLTNTTLTLLFPWCVFFCACVCHLTVPYVQNKHVFLLTYCICVRATLQRCFYVFLCEHMCENRAVMSYCMCGSAEGHDCVWSSTGGVRGLFSACLLPEWCSTEARLWPGVPEERQEPAGRINTL